jgi:2-iminobutanoate/2-iminopropanoate deaminase
MSGRKPVATSAAPAAVGPYSQGVRTDHWVFTAGQVGFEPTTGMLVEGTAAQADRALRNIAAILDAAGSDMDRVVKTTIFLIDMADWDAVNEVYARHFSAPFPARSTIQVVSLPKGAAVEIEAIAMTGDGG